MCLQNGTMRNWNGRNRQQSTQLFFTSLMNDIVQSMLYGRLFINKMNADFFCCPYLSTGYSQFSGLIIFFLTIEVKIDCF